MRSNCNDHLRADPAQAAMVDGAIPVTARAALDRSPDYGVAFLIEWCPTSIIRRAEDRNTQSVNGTGNVSGAGVIADKEIQCTDQRSKPAKRGSPHQVNRFCRHALCDRMHNSLLIRISSQDDLRIEPPGKVIGERSKELCWPAPGR